MKKLIFASIITAVALVVISESSYASPVLSGITSFAGDSLWTATVNWEVYAPGDTASHLSADSDYHYFYYVTNTSGKGGASLKSFTVGNPFKAPIVLSGYLDRGTGTPAPSTVGVFEDSTAYIFFTDVIDPSEASDWLYYTSPTEPAMVTAGLIDGGKTDFEAVPGPAPEPSTILLLGTGLFGFVGGAARKKKV